MGCALFVGLAYVYIEHDVDGSDLDHESLPAKLAASVFSAFLLYTGVCQCLSVCVSVCVVLPLAPFSVFSAFLLYTGVCVSVCLSVCL